MIITIDGPAGSGKSTAAKLLAKRLGATYLDTGAMYRAVALKAIRQGVDLSDAESLAELAAGSDIRFESRSGGQKVLLDGEDVTEAIRSMEVNEATPMVARVPGVRAALIAKQRDIAKQVGPLVAEGRDQGSIVFPEAEVKFLLDASAETRARRRFDEMRRNGQSVTYEQVLANLIERDQTDEKQWAPLLDDPNVVKIDTTELSIEQVVDRLYEEVKRALAERNRTNRASSKP